MSVLLISQKIYKILSFTVNTGYFFRVIPFYWDQDHNLMYFGDGYFSDRARRKSYKIRAWDVMKCSYFLYLLFSIVGFARLIIENTTDFRSIFVQVVFILSFALLSMIQAAVIIYHQQLILFFNQGFVFYRKLEGEFLTNYYFSGNKVLKFYTLCILFKVNFLVRVNFLRHGKKIWN